MSKNNRNELITRHGIQGSMMLRLQRFSLLGWFLFFFLLVMNVIVIGIDRMIPEPVIAVDESGRVLGTFEFMDASQRTEQEILAGAMYFVRNYVNVNSSTIFEDYASAINMMASDFAQETLAGVRRSGYLTAIKEAETQSRVKFARGAEQPVIIRREGLETVVHLRGNIVVRHSNGKERATPFDLTVFMQLKPRTTLSTRGLQVFKIKEREIK
jgi:hypothetical protein